MKTCEISRPLSVCLSNIQEGLLFCRQGCESVLVSWLLKLGCWLKQQYYIQSVLPSLLQWNKERLSYGAVYPDPHLGAARRPGTPLSARQELIEGDLFCPTAAEPGTAEGNDEEGWAGNQQQGDRDDEEIGGPCAAPAGPGGAGEAEVPARRGEDCPEAVVSPGPCSQSLVACIAVQPERQACLGQGGLPRRCSHPLSLLSI